MKLTLQRLATAAPAALGTLSVDGAYHSDTLERPWLENRRMASCIPAGSYKVTLGYSGRFGRNMLRVLDVPERDGILIHAANHVLELNGCIALGKRLAADALMESRAAVQALEGKVRAAMAKGEEVWMDVKNPEVV